MGKSVPWFPNAGTVVAAKWAFKCRCVLFMWLYYMYWGRFLMALSQWCSLINVEVIYLPNHIDTLTRMFLRINHQHRAEAFKFSGADVSIGDG